MSKIPRNCDWCNTEYQAETRELRRGNGIFCSRACSGQYRASNKVQKEHNTVCGWCNCSFYRKPSSKTAKSGLYFCSREHQRLAVKDPSIPLSPGPKKAFEDPRPLCSKGCGTRTSLDSGVCHRCTTTHNKDLWLLEGNLEATYVGRGKDPAGWVKAHLIETRGDKCESCGFDQKSPSGRSIIQMDHVDGNYLNNALDNLRLLCPNCHAMTETYGSLNKSGGRAYRRKSFEK